MHSPERSSNRLAQATSPYLLQHAENPVDWHPWGEEALASARELDRPILLSIGYSACHWCHVMAHESFEDPATAAVMNELFVNIKVDREERPDLDRIYQAAHQLLSGRPGGWPLTMFLSPADQMPFFGGTYFPPEPRHRLPAFRDLLRSIAQAYREQRREIDGQRDAMLDALSSLTPKLGPETALDSGPLEQARQQLSASYDARYGGFGEAPKFPHPASLEFLLRHWQATALAGQPDGGALEMATHTLERMALGGVNDQLGGGFYRYSVDERWEIPHFEKMLYDNAQLLALYLDAWQATGRPLFRRTAEATADWLLREMQAPEGGYYSSLDADSEGAEGLFYLWRPEPARAALTTEEWELFAPLHGLDQKPNFEGQWHLKRTEDELEEGQQALLASARAKLLAQRETRVRPGRDDKVLTSWNALTIKGMARAGRILGRADYLKSAERALAFLRHTHWRDGRLLATSRDGRAQLAAYLDDHAFLIDALLELLQARWSSADLAWLQALAALLLKRFEDRDQGGFFFTADDQEVLIQRPKPLGDEATPAGNGVAARALLRLGHLLGDGRYLEAAERCLLLAWDQLKQIPYAHCSLLAALDEYLEPGETLLLRGQATELAPWQTRLDLGYAPRRLGLAIPADADGLPQALAERAPRSGPVAYLCSGASCAPPIETLAALETALGASEPPPPP